MLHIRFFFALLFNTPLISETFRREFTISGAKGYNYNLIIYFNPRRVVRAISSPYKQFLYQYYFNIKILAIYTNIFKK
ncbi:hypothetical protein LEP1GSC050_0443 [Leptospira broomii serovar Hurstbridge str. 5399]|uniref:Uncharacterized protein n=1 Tax=Leptospira broomii serovar Hurstbridge str. 5399 TaxID=1049789 RepID=T0GHU9_9LEPT|nr:hypothetical protein LEP1GSC050_0443 [Leptospira broomii serovar Hurstbridge str. 5399]